MAHDDNAIYDKDNDDNDNVYDENALKLLLIWG